MADNIGINAVPASKLLVNWYPTNEWRDAFVVIPKALDGAVSTFVHGSFGDAWPTLDSDWSIEMRDDTNAVVASYQYTHPASSRSYFENTQVGISGPPITLVAGYTLNVKYRNGLAWGLDSTSKGYTITLMVEL
jgi:hypothetical protein